MNQITEDFLVEGSQYNAEDYAVAYLDDADAAGAAVAHLIDHSIWFHTIVNPGAMYIIVDQYSFADFPLDEELTNSGIAHTMVKYSGTVLSNE